MSLDEDRKLAKRESEELEGLRDRLNSLSVGDRLRWPDLDGTGE
jgi:hypothetical protein